MSSAEPIRYRSADEDSGRWHGFAFREGDIIISTRSKHGTTWMQMVSALLVLQSPLLPEPLATLSPWLDWLAVPLDEVSGHLGAQEHRRIIKTHTPLDGIPLDDRATYVVVARHPLDAAVSLYHQGENLDRARLQELTGEPSAPRRPPIEEWLDSWVRWDGDPAAALDSLPGVCRHLGDAWARRGAANIVLVHYDDLRADLGEQMRSLASRLAIVVPDERWPELVGAAGFEQMRERAAELAPDPVGVLKDLKAFFRRGTSGAGRELVTEAQHERYRSRVAELLPLDLDAWLHR